jgi:hypothetical protein
VILHLAVIQMVRCDVGGDGHRLLLSSR